MSCEVGLRREIRPYSRAFAAARVKPRGMTWPWPRIWNDPLMFNPGNCQLPPATRRPIDCAGPFGPLRVQRGHLGDPIGIALCVVG